MKCENCLAFVSNGSRIEAFSLEHDELISSFKLNDGQDIYKFVEGRDGIFVFEETILRHVSNEELFDPKHKRKEGLKLEFYEQLLGGVFVPDADEIILFSRSMAVSRIKICFDAFETQTLCSIAPNRHAMLTSCETLGKNWSDLVIISGTSMGELFLFKPATGQETSCKDQNGMIFDMCVYGMTLCVVSDDRTLSVYDCSSFLQNDRDDLLPPKKLDTCFGHYSRPFAVSTDEDGNIYTGGQDETLFLWRWSGHNLKLISKREVHRGYIRALGMFHKSVLVGCESGALVRISRAHIEDEPILSSSPEDSVKSFVRLSTGEFDVLKHSPKTDVRFISGTVLDPKVSKYVALVGDKKIMVRENKKDTVFEIDFEAEVLEVIVDGSFMFVYLANNKAELVLINRGIVYANMNFNIALKELRVRSKVKITAFAVTVTENRLTIVVGTATGQLFYGSSVCEDNGSIDMRTSKELNSHFKKGPVNQLLFYDAGLFALGRNGVLVNSLLRSNGELSIISARPLCPWLPGFVPCGLSSNANLILGFKGQNFCVIDYFTREIIDSVNCGGPNRQWYFTRHPSERCSDPKDLKMLFDFLSKGRIITAQLQNKCMSVLAPAPHRSRIIGMTMLNVDRLSPLVATVGADHILSIFRIGSPENGLETHLSIYNDATPTCVCSLFLLSGEFVIIVGGEKGIITSWFVSPNDLFKKDPRFVFSSVYKRELSSARVMTMAIDEETVSGPLSNHHCVAAYADGVVEILKIAFDDDKPTMSLQLLERIKSDPVLSTPVKVLCYQNCTDNRLHINMITTSGRRVFYNVVTGHPTIGASEEIDKCGLSALGVFTTTEGNYLIFGSESGLVSVGLAHTGPMIWMSSFIYHSSTVTGFSIFSCRTGIYFLSISLDCRMALWHLSTTNRNLEFIKGFTLDVCDPCGVYRLMNGGIVVGDGMEYVPIDDADIDNASY
ncbi:hypothetical protein RB195_021587 [Necator americanus]|uniref:tRNA (34-2'-O)-methyltransferase regulator WDR6 n=1 Tax=Necator americanus TaxID=51031 RepID=A0ABR1EBY9_NECAM